MKKSRCKYNQINYLLFLYRIDQTDKSKDMHIADFLKLELKYFDYIWIMNEKGEGFYGNYLGTADSSNQSFKFQNHSNGQTQIIEVGKLQMLQIKQRAKI